MKNLTFTLLILVWLQLLSFNLSAKNPEGRFYLKEGDWFEVQVEENGDKSFLLKYQLQKQLPNNNQLYNIQLEHYKVRRKSGNNYFGYDSYYPTFEENRTSPEIKNQFSLEVTSNGEIVRFTSSKNNKSRIINWDEDMSIQGINYTCTYTENMSDSLLLKYFSCILMKPILNPELKNTDKIIGIRYNEINDKDSIPIEVPYLKERKVPLLIKLTDYEFLLINASFPLTDNTIILGKIKDQINQDIRISMIGENQEYYFPEKQFRTTNDGSFNCPIFLKRPLHLRIQVGNKILTTFMEPGDTLNIYEFGHQAVELTQNHYRDTKANGYFLPNTKKSDYFSGNAAYNTMLSNEIDQFRNKFSSNYGVQDAISYCQETTKAVNILIDSYEGKASRNCIEYFKSDWKYFIASDKYSFYVQYNRPKILSNTNFHKKYFPLDSFLEGDTMPVLLNSFEWNSSYQNFINEAEHFRKNRMGWDYFRSTSENFLKNYSFSQATLEGYPLYNQIAKSIYSSLKSRLLSIDYIEPYFKDFLNNCADPALVEPLKETHKIAEMFVPGHVFPFQLLSFPDGNTQSIKAYKGRAVFLYISRTLQDLKPYITEIKKFKTDEIEFIFIFRNSEIDKDQINKTGLLAFPNVKVLFRDEKYFDVFGAWSARSFTLDKWSRIIETDKLLNLQYGAGQPLSIEEFEKSLQKALETKHYSKAEKTAMIKTAGWSLGSILLTVLIGLWVYKVRVRKLKKQEAAKRRIKELEIKAVRSQMNPHFIFNALNSIQSLINGNQFKEANIYLSKFAVLLRGVLNNSEKPMVTLSDELQAVELYCQLEQLRFEFKFEIIIDPNVNTDIIEIPGMIIQPLVENAIVHGLSPKGNEGKLTIRIEKQNGNLCVCVTDNGVGLDSQKVDELSQKGFGLKLVEERINILNLDGKEAKLNVENRNDANGTLATLIIPID